MHKQIKIAYIGGGSKQWARVFMSDLAVSEDLSGQIALYDIDQEAARRNAAIGQRINENPVTRSKFQYLVCPTLEEALENADFVIISILPGTFREMRSDVHTPEKYGVYQAVGDTVGPGGVLRAMRTVPIYEEFARKIRDICPNAWVLNLTNPMSICTKVLYDVFPGIKAFGCCHEVFHAQEFLTCVLRETRGIDVRRTDIYTSLYDSPANTLATYSYFSSAVHALFCFRCCKLSGPRASSCRTQIRIMSRNLFSFIPVGVSGQFPWRYKSTHINLYS